MKHIKSRHRDMFCYANQQRWQQLLIHWFMPKPKRHIWKHMKTWKTPSWCKLNSLLLVQSSSSWVWFWLKPRSGEVEFTACAKNGSDGVSVSKVGVDKGRHRPLCLLPKGIQKISTMTHTLHRNECGSLSDGIWKRLLIPVCCQETHPQISHVRLSKKLISCRVLY